MEPVNHIQYTYFTSLQDENTVKSYCSMYTSSHSLSLNNKHIEHCSYLQKKARDENGAAESA